MADLYGKINRDIVPMTYEGVDTETAETIVDNKNKTIKVNVIRDAIIDANPTLVGTEENLTSIKINGTSYKNQPSSISYSTTVPTAANTDGVKIVVLSSEPATRYDGWLYIILGS